MHQANQSNVRVYVRIRPLDEKEQFEGGHECISVNQQHKQIIANNHQIDNLTFTFDEVLDKSATQLNV